MQSGLNGEEVISDLTAQYQSILLYIPKEDDHVQLTAQLKAVQDDYSQLTDDFNSVCGAMKLWLEKYDAYTRLASSIEHLLAETESEEDISSPSADLSSRLDRLKQLRRSLDMLRSREDELATLSMLALDLGVETEETRWTMEAVELSDRFHSRMKQLEVCSRHVGTIFEQICIV